MVDVKTAINLFVNPFTAISRNGLLLDDPVTLPGFVLLWMDDACAPQTAPTRIHSAQHKALISWEIGPDSQIAVPEID